jgi:hypothetical protein
VKVKIFWFVIWFGSNTLNPSENAMKWRARGAVIVVEFAIVVVLLVLTTRFQIPFRRSHKVCDFASSENACCESSGSGKL